MTVAYPLKKQKDYSELKFSLRSLDKFLPKPYEVLIIGDKLPDWINNVTQIRVGDTLSKKQLTIKYKIMAALIKSNEILFMNDDVMLTQEQDDFPYYFHGDLVSVGESGARVLRKQLVEKGKPTKNFDGHYPLIYRPCFFDIMENFTEDVVVKSAYCNWLEIEGVQIADNKFLNEKSEDEVKRFIKNRSSISTGVLSWPRVKPVVEEMFKGKSIYER